MFTFHKSCVYSAKFRVRTWEEQDWNDSDGTQVHSRRNIHSGPYQQPQTLGNQAENIKSE